MIHKDLSLDYSYILTIYTVCFCEALGSCATQLSIKLLIKNFHLTSSQKFDF